MPTTPKFDEPWMDELDGHNCVSRAISFGARGAFVGKCTEFVNVIVVPSNQASRQKHERWKTLAHFM